MNEVEIFVGVFIVLAVVAGCLIWKIGRSARLMHDTKVSAARSSAKAELAEQTAGRLFGVADKALARAEEIHEVNEKMDELLGFVARDEAPHGRHSNLRVIPGSPVEEGYVA